MKVAQVFVNRLFAILQVRDGPNRNRLGDILIAEEQDLEQGRAGDQRRDDCPNHCY